MTWNGPFASSLTADLRVREEEATQRANQSLSLLACPSPPLFYEFLKPLSVPTQLLLIHLPI